jgi:formylglycine-generating enzyme required for sulfatase activity
MFLKRICICISFVFSGFSLSAQESTFTNPQGIEFILIKPGKMVVGKFQPTVNRGSFGAGPNRTANANPVGQAPPAPVRPALGKLPESDYQLAEKLAKEDALPGFEVTIQKPFYIGKFEITQEQWKKVMGTNPSYFKEGKVTDNADQHPVESVTWQNAQAFIKKLNALDKGRNYRLPTEFEWEYAARAGAQDDISWSDIRAAAVIAIKTTSAVGTKKPNAWGLYDTLGNVWEWVHDYYNEKIFADPMPPKSGKEHVLKGAPFYGDVKNATYMTHAAGPGSKYDVGFRIVMEVK